MKSRRNTRWVVLGFLFLTSIVTYLDRVNISVAGRPMSEEFGLTDVQFGAMFSAFLLGYALFQIPGGWLGDRFGHKPVLIGALFSWSLLTVLTPWSGRGFLVPLLGVLPSICLVRFLIGLGEAAAYPCSSALAGQWFSSDRKGLATGVIFAGIGLGSTLAPPFVTWLMVRMSWEQSFYVCGVLGVILGIFFWWMVPGRPRAPEGEKPPPAPAGFLPGESESKPARTEVFRSLAGNLNVWFLALSYGTVGYVVYVFFAWFFRYLVDERGIEIMEASVLAMFPFLAMAVCAPLGGWWSDRLVPGRGRLGARRSVAFGGLLSSVPLMLLGAVTEETGLSVLFFSLSFGMLTLTTGCYWAAAIDLAPRHAGVVGATMNMGTNLVGMFAPILTPFVKDRFGWAAAWTVAAAFGLAAGLLWVLIRERPSRNPGSGGPSDLRRPPVTPGKGAQGGVSGGAGIPAGRERA